MAKVCQASLFKQQVYLQTSIIILSYISNCIHQFKSIQHMQHTDNPPPQPIHTNPHITHLLEFQNQFINLVHSQLYTQPTITQQIIVRFQINHITDINQEWKKMVEQLHEELVTQKLPYHNQLRDYFHRVLGVEFLPLLRVNRYEITQLSLFGFDIYVEPLSAILQIINRIDGLMHPVESGKNNTQYRYKPGDIWEALKKGWSNLIYQSTLYRISLNLYILKQYLKIGTKSLMRKDKEIIFTGCSNIFSIFVPILKQKKQIWLLCQLSQLANQLYQFHPSFNYSFFYTLLLPIQKQYQPIFAPIKEIGQKCLNTNILTPLLLGILRHHEDFMKFIEQADDQVWAPYLNGLAYALVLNFKARILEYEQVMELLKATLSKLGLMGKLNISFIAGQLDKEWNEARQFFISALKAGYNSGDLQLWHPTPHLEVQDKIIECTRNSLFLNAKPQQEQGSDLFINGNNFDYFKEYLKTLTDNRITVDDLMSTYNNRLVETLEVTNSYNYNLFRTAHTFQNCQSDLTSNPNALAYMLNFFTLADHTDSSLHRKNIQSYGKFLNKKSLQVLQSTKSQHLREALYNYDNKYEGIIDEEKLILILSLQNPKNALHKLFDLMPQIDEDKINLISATIVALFTPKQQGQRAKLKTFSKEYEVPQEIVNLPNKIHSCLSFLIEEAISNEQNKSEESLAILRNIVRARGWLAIPVLTFPIHISPQSVKEDKLQLFAIWFIENQTKHSMLIELVKEGNIANLRQYYSQVILISICEHIINFINLKVRNENYEDAIMLLNLLHSLHSNYCSVNTQLYKKMTEMYIRLMPKLPEDIQFLKIALNGYAGVIESLLGSSQALKKWRIMQTKSVSVASSVSIEPVKNFQMIWLPSIKDNVVFSQNYNQAKHQFLSNHEQVQGAIKAILNTLQKKQQNSADCFALWKPLDPSQIRKSQMKNLAQLKEYRDHVPALLQQKIIKNILTEIKDENQLIHFISVLRLTPANCFQIMKWAIQEQNINILSQIGYSRQANNLSYEIFKLICSSPQVQDKMLESLDHETKQTIAEGFTLLEKHLEHFVKLPKFDFLISLNQSNWRFTNEKLSAMATYLNIASVILQYTEYIRITKNGNEQYDEKLAKYENVVGKYTRILKEKQYRLFGNQKKQHKGYIIEEEQFQLLRTNQIANLKIFSESASFKDLLLRLVEFENEVSLYEVKINFKILPYIEELNQMANKLGNGHILSPDFLLSHRFSSAKVVERYNFQLGYYLQHYYDKMDLHNHQSYQPTSQFMQELNFTEFQQIIQIEKPLNVKQMNVDDATTFMKTLEQYLIKENALQKEKDMIKVVKVDEFSPQIYAKFYKLGYLMRKCKSQIKLGPLLCENCERVPYSWQVLRQYEPQQYHHIKAVLIDDQVGNRKLTMTHNEKQLVKNGQKINVNQLNKERYCNLLGLFCLGEGTIKNAQAFGRGYQS